MNDKLQKIYYIIGIIQRILMILLTFSIYIGAYKIYKLSMQSLTLIQQYRIEIKEIHRIIEIIYQTLHKSWFF
jgi:hypothetical protein